MGKLRSLLACFTLQMVATGLVKDLAKALLLVEYNGCIVCHLAFIEATNLLIPSTEYLWGIFVKDL